MLQKFQNLCPQSWNPHRDSEFSSINFEQETQIVVNVQLFNKTKLRLLGSNPTVRANPKYVPEMFKSESESADLIIGSS